MYIFLSFSFFISFSLFTNFLPVAVLNFVGSGPRAAAELDSALTAAAVSEYFAPLHSAGKLVANSVGTPSYRCFG